MISTLTAWHGSLSYNMLYLSKPFNLLPYRIITNDYKDQTASKEHSLDVTFQFSHRTFVSLSSAKEVPTKNLNIKEAARARRYSTFPPGALSLITTSLPTAARAACHDALILCHNSCYHVQSLALKPSALLKQPTPSGLLFDTKSSKF
jgi:hypothetical protein